MISIRRCFLEEIMTLNTITNFTELFSGNRNAYGQFIPADKQAEEGYKAIVTYSFLVVTPDDMEHKMVLTLKNTDVPAAKDWNTMIRELKLEDGSLCPIFGGIWTLTSTFREGKKGSWYSLSDGKGSNIKFKGFIDDELVDAVADASRLAIEASTVSALPESTEENSGEKDM